MGQETLVRPFAAVILENRGDLLPFGDLVGQFPSALAFLEAIPADARGRLFGEAAGPMGELILEAPPAELALDKWYVKAVEKRAVGEAEHAAALTAEVLGQFPFKVIRGWLEASEWYLDKSEAASTLVTALAGFFLELFPEYWETLFDHAVESMLDNVPREDLKTAMMAGRQTGKPVSIDQLLQSQFGVEGVVKHAAPNVVWGFLSGVFASWEAKLEEPAVEEEVEVEEEIEAATDDAEE